jgi:hypothetical protein
LVHVLFRRSKDFNSGEGTTSIPEEAKTSIPEEAETSIPEKQTGEAKTSIPEKQESQSILTPLPTQGPLLESHAGSTFCGIATLVLLNKLDFVFGEGSRKRARLLEWLLARQNFGFQGRPNKKSDTCYGYWVGASLSLLGAYSLVDIESNASFTLNTQSPIGGLSKWADHHPDPLHTHLGLCALSLMGIGGLKDIHPGLGISRSAAEVFESP